MAKSPAAPVAPKEPSEGPKVQLSNGKVRVNGEEQATRPIPKAFEDSEVRANAPEPQAPEEPEPYQPTPHLNDEEFADFKAKVVEAAADTNEGSTKKKPVPGAGARDSTSKKAFKQTNRQRRNPPPQPGASASKAAAESESSTATPAAAETKKASTTNGFSDELARRGRFVRSLARRLPPTPAAASEKAVGALHKTLLAKFGGQAKALRTTSRQGSRSSCRPGPGSRHGRQGR